MAAKKRLAVVLTDAYHEAGVALVGLPPPERRRHATLSRRCKVPGVAKLFVLLALVMVFKEDGSAA